MVKQHENNFFTRSIMPVAVAKSFFVTGMLMRVLFAAAHFLVDKEL